MQPENPFRYGAPVEAASFCNRTEELEALTARMRDGIHAFVLSPRRYGKTSLLLEALRRLRKDGGRAGYANLLLCTTEAEVSGVVLTAVVREILRPVGRTRRSIEDVLRGLRVAPQIELSADGKISLILHPATTSERWYEVLEDAVALLERAGEKRPAALVLDEFQQVAEIGPKGLGGAFKALADQARGTSLVFAGSRLSVMERLTRGRGAPLLGMGETFNLDVVPENEMTAHLVARARRGGKRLTRADARSLYRRANGIPNDVQWLAHAAYEVAGDIIDEEAIDAGLAAIVGRQAGFFAERYESLAPSQQRIVRELARSPREKVYAKAFLDAVMVANANAVTTALRTLAEHELVRREGRQWRLASPFFRAWLLDHLDA
ncbi:MAG TPA: ATP-binding protein [Acidimicrobiia bacterium]|nr:ATP-binding protein [Acidimicrobiia bacterium]